MVPSAKKHATNERIALLLEQVQSELADSKRREEQMVRDIGRLLKRMAA